jgi:hypothetical protein
MNEIGSYYYAVKLTWHKPEDAGRPVLSFISPFSVKKG